MTCRTYSWQSLVTVTYWNMLKREVKSFLTWKSVMLRRENEKSRLEFERMKLEEEMLEQKAL